MRASTKSDLLSILMNVLAVTCFVVGGTVQGWAFLLAGIFMLGVSYVCEAVEVRSD